tara:strand:+ start:51570 stop:53237 length:1668 start_codon:yes stop_codon:yes gene_type:complete
MLFDYLYYILQRISKWIISIFKSFITNTKSASYDKYNIDHHKLELINNLQNIYSSIQELFQQVSINLDSTLNETNCCKISKLAFSGGGAKCVVYPGAYRALLDSRMIDQIEQVSGASAGSINAAFIATGMPISKFRENLFSTNFKSLLGKKVGIFSQSPGTIRFLTRNGDPLYKFIKKNINESVFNFINSSEFELRSQYKQNQNDQDIENLFSLKEKVLKTNINSLNITFIEIALLHKFFPDKFKLLTINAAKHPGGELKIFNSSKTPDTEIALACRASSSIPGLLLPIDINGERFVDGGINDNLPVKYFEKSTKKTVSSQSDTLLFAFGEGADNRYNWIHQALYGSYINQQNNIPIFNPSWLSMIIRKIPNLIGILDTPFGLDEQKDKGLQKIRKFHALRTVELKIGNIKIIDFDIAEQYANIMDTLGYLDTMNYLINHNGFDLNALNVNPKFYTNLYSTFKITFKFIQENSYLKISKTDKNFLHLLNLNINKELECSESIAREKIYKIKEHTEINVSSTVAFILSLSVELVTNITTPEKMCGKITEFTNKYSF